LAFSNMPRVTCMPCECSANGRKRHLYWWTYFGRRYDGNTRHCRFRKVRNRNQRLQTLEFVLFLVSLDVSRLTSQHLEEKLTRWIGVTSKLRAWYHLRTCILLSLSASSHLISPHPGTIFTCVFGCANNGEVGRSEEYLLEGDDGFRCHDFREEEGSYCARLRQRWRLYSFISITSSDGCSLR
jgi:hypothetical protein